MRWLNTIVLLSGLSMALAQLAGAQPADGLDKTPTTQPEGTHRPMRMEGILERLENVVKELKLTDEQRTQIQKRIDQTREELRPILAEKDAAKEEIRRAVADVIHKMHADISGLLTEEQKDMLYSKLEEMRGGPETRPSARDRGLERMKQIGEKLQLTDDQKARANEVLEDARTRLKELRDSAQIGASREEIRAKAKVIFQDTVKRFREILTPEQQEKLRELMHEQRPGGPATQPAQ